MAIVNLGIIELITTYRCDLMCPNCWGMCSAAPVSGDLSAARVAEFLDWHDSVGHRWGLITVSGGEAALNPEIVEICRIVRAYQAAHRSEAWILTNDKSAETRAVIQEVEAFGMHTGKADKGPLWMPYDRPCESPEDLGLPWTRGCFQSRTCGCSFNYMCGKDELWPCSVMAGAARLFGYKPAKWLDGEAALETKMMEHCRKCGLALEPRRPRSIKRKTTRTWDEAMKLYNDRRRSNNTSP